ncbi:MAG: hypothetical protein A2Y98_01185 [Candidatus Portnoybacteria bacterium RBG_19FT_COMBO_36_7]|uniref:Uncharacterized protein n=1 Tax=Candidatus Portnoybacteria bacterium RBG_19FT_COMBO_36_7 TaxID=1801992 RepID=A0A1G2F7C8_9BACT|nr:MAG: hypothetical protein A2Y98_01185 [Candidatus Portnoybacteria bacterium RBG_19FT_COMBO_36_7]
MFNHPPRPKQKPHLRWQKLPYPPKIDKRTFVCNIWVNIMRIPKNIKITNNVKTVLDILNDEIKGDVKAALKKMKAGYTMTWVYQGKNDRLFPKTSVDIKNELAVVYPIKGREYDIKNIAEGQEVVMVEMIESYPDPKTKKVYRTPLVVVLEIDKGKIKKGRHYCDPRLSYMYLTKKQVSKLFS